MKPQLSKFEKNKPLKSLSTLGIGGLASLYIEVDTQEAMQSALIFCKESMIPFLVLGKGSNCLFDDRGFNGCIIHNKIHFLNTSDEGMFHAGAGYSFSRLGTQTAKLGFTGLEFASGIPASVGGAVFMNAGANGGETQDCLISVDFIDSKGNLSVFMKEELIFKYRYSSFQDKSGAIVGATFFLKKNPDARIKQFKLIEYRQKTQPYSEQSLGCVFRNPDGKAAGQLIETCGLKEYQIGDAAVSALHGNFLINRNEASAAQFKELICYVKTQVKQQTGIDLECEIRHIPYEL